MSAQRITKRDLEVRVENLNRRMESRNSMYRYEVSARSGYTAIDRVRPSGDMVNVVRVGTKREVGEFLYAMMVALDDATYTEGE